MNLGGWGGAVHKPRSVEHGGVKLMIMVRPPNTSTAPKPLHEVPMLKPDTKNQIARRVVKRVAMQMAAAFPEATHSVDGTLGVFVLPTNGEAVRFKDHVQRLAIEPYTEQTIDAKIVSGELTIKATLTDPNIKAQQYTIMLGTCYADVPIFYSHVPSSCRSSRQLLRKRRTAPSSRASRPTRSSSYQSWRAQQAMAAPKRR
jgi:hypothetical protein